jgi:hypothetical protein
MKKLILALVFSLVTIWAVAQSGWSSGQYYAYKGQTIEQCGNAYPKYDAWGNWYGNFVSCRVLKWEQQQYSGYVYYWNSNTGQWYSQWQSGYSWYCWWSGWYEKRVW